MKQSSPSVCGEIVSDRCELLCKLLAAIIHEENSQSQALRAEWYLG
jgi:hypothetical protein